jgi:serine/threonine protein kinase
VLCYQCGSPVSGDVSECPNCGADLERRKSRRVEVKSEGLERFTQKLKPVTAEDRRLVPMGELFASRFEVGERLGRGVFGEVYLADDYEVEAEVALKVFDEELLRNPRIHERFLEATRKARTLTQKNVVRIHESGVSGDSGWVSMEPLEGLTLDKVLKLRASKGEHFSAEELEPFVTQITLAQQHTARAYPNGNLRPETIFFLPELVKITDYYVFEAFGPELAAERLADSPYLAPELRDGDAGPDERADVYSLGAMLCEMRFGSHEIPADLDGADSAIARLCRRAMATDRSRRYPNLEALAEDFSTALDTGRLLETGPPAPPPSEPEAAPKAPPPPPGGASKESGAPPTPPAQPSPPEAPVGPDPEQSAAPAPEPAEPLDELSEVETVRMDREEADEGSGLELQDHLPTHELDREEEEELLATHEYDRESAEKLRRERGLGEESSEPVAIERAPEPDTDVGSQPTESPARASRKDQREDDEGSPPWLLVALGLLGAIALVAIVAANGGGEDDKEVVKLGSADSDDDENNAATAQTSGATTADDEGDDEGLSEERRAALGDAPSKAGAGLLAARGDAVEEARSAAEKLEEAAAEKDGGGKESSSSGGRRGGRSTGASGGKAARKTKCPAGMTLVRGREENFCIARYEYPGRRGRKPKTNVTWFDARKMCEQRGRRLCELSEWKKACGGTYPYGRSFDPNRCNTVDEDEFERELAASGSFKQCRSPSGAYDMSGNVHEWVAERKIAGGGFESGASVASCRFASSKKASSSDPYIGFRCCADPS